ncbi:MULTISPECIES: DUF3105 domain-containing protein [unclassified Nocardioides]|uniref:DUF3105 domain-containing protein n=1 Tax=unclassified Nocardioides TaxID=2615069 RepID=UPI000A2688BE|nr:MULTISPECIES: DUF3105 domain-containing protein [unclassified Nocardioides]
MGTPNQPGRQRTERVQELRLTQARRERRRTLLLWAGVAFALVLIAAGLGVAARESGSVEQTLDTATTPTADLSAVEQYDVKSDHVTGQLDYAQTPPAGGPHNPIWLNCAVYDTAVPNENAVHSMEHGAIWITYDPDLPETDIALLREATPDSYAILSPFDGAPAPVVASAWGAQLQLDGADDPRLAQFIAAYRMGGNAPEIGASCSGGSDGTLALDASNGM